MSRRASTQNRLRKRNRRATSRPVVEVMEDRLLLATVGISCVVNSNLDTNARDTVLTLREAIEITNGDLAFGSLTPQEQAQVSSSGTGTDTIGFNIPGAGPHVIATPGYTISSPVIIDGYTQPGANRNTLPNGNNATLQIIVQSYLESYAGLSISAGDSTVSGLVVQGFPVAGIELTGAGGNTIEGNFIGTDPTGQTDYLTGNGTGVLISNSPDNTIGGTTPGSRNLISGNTAEGVLIEDLFGGGDATGNLVQGNFIGTNVSGLLPLGNGVGVSIEGGSDNTIGGAAAGAGNIISGNAGNGVSIAPSTFSIYFSDAARNIVQGNYIGLNVNGSAPLLNSGDGVFVSGASDTIIGGTTPEARNVISGNEENGVQITELDVTGSPFTAVRNVVQGNYIGTDATGTIPFGNAASGVLFDTFAGADNTVGGTAPGAGNLIAFNGKAGVTVLGGSGNGILTNSIVSNAHLGIDLGGDGVTPNHPVGDTDGPNNFQNYPVLTSALAGATNTTITGTLTSTPNTTITVQFFANRAADPSGYGQGQTYLGQADVTTDGLGVVTFTASVAAVPIDQGVITATATDPANNTSEFSQAIDAISFIVVNTNDSGFGSLRQAIINANDTPGLQTITFAIPGTGPFVIAPLTELPTITDPVVIDAYTQAGSSRNTLPNGDNAVLQVIVQATSSTFDGLTITAGGTTVSGLVIQNFQGAAIHISGPGGNTIEGNFLGTSANGLTASGNGVGVSISTSSNNTIGGTTPGTRNLISGNSVAGVAINDPYQSGVTGNLVQGNFIGTNANGSLPLANGVGVLISGASDNTVGGTVAGAGNIISGNTGDGVSIASQLQTFTFYDAPRNTVQGNFIGLDANGQNPVPNGGNGVTITGATENLVGGTTPAARNIISGNAQSGVRIVENSFSVFYSNAARNLVQGNYIGTDVSGTLERGNTLDGVLLDSAQNNTIGGTATGAGNLISGNKVSGIEVVNNGLTTSSGNRIQGNLIGTDLSGANPLGNTANGVLFNTGAAAGNTVGGTVAGAGNTIAYNGGAGVRVEAGSGNGILTNSIVANAALGIDLRSAGNNLQNFPVLDSALSGATGTTISGTLTSTPGASFTVQFFANLAADPSGFGQGQTYLGQAVVTTNSLGVATFSALVSALPAGQNIVTATATDSGNNTSQFSRAIVANSFVVVNTNDSGFGSLRQAIINANSVPGLQTVTFAIPGTGPFTISPQSELTNITDPVVIDATSQPGFAGRPIVEVAGVNAGSGANGLVVLSGGAGSTVRGLAINRFGGAGIVLTAPGGNTIVGNFIGTDVTGTLAMGNGLHGIFSETGSSNNRIGGTAAADRNVISGNTDIGIAIFSPATGNQILGNYIGTDVTGTHALGNGAGVGIGVFNNIGTSNGNTIAGNVISGNLGNGILLISPGTFGNLVQGNFIGTDPTGTTPLGNGGDGVQVRFGSHDNTIGGTSPSQRNIIADNGGNGVSLIDSGSTRNLVLGNFIGTNPAGASNLGNHYVGVNVTGASGNTIGGATPGAGNVISGNGQSGVKVLGSGASGNLVLGNFIGTDPTGLRALGNAGAGVSVNYAPNNTIGGATPGAGNVISGNSVAGVEISGEGATGNLVQGNRIGTDASGSRPLANGVGVLIEGASDNLIGGSAAGAGNVISGNTAQGVLITAVVSGVSSSYFYSDAARNRLQGNFIGLDARGAGPLPNGDDGVSILGASANVIGGASASMRNLISSNLGNGVQIAPFLAFEGRVFSAPNNLVQGNFIGTDAAGVANRGNRLNGVLIIGSSNNLIGGTASGVGNLIVFNGGAGVRVASGTGNGILTNAIALNSGLGIALGTDGVSRKIQNEPDPGPNNLQNFPVLDGAVSDGTGTTVSGSLTSTPNQTFLVQFFANTAADPSGFGEGLTFLGQTTVTTNRLGVATFSTLVGALPAGQEIVTATATDPANNTSEFSKAVAANSFIVVNTNDSGFGSLRQAIINTNRAPGRQTISFKIPGTGPFTIAPLSELPSITDPVVINAQTQPGFQYQPIVVLSGARLGPESNGLTVLAGHSAVLGLIVNQFRGSGVVLETQGGNLIAGNILGTDANGAPGLGNGGSGLVVIASANNSVFGNVVSGNASVGIHIFGASSSGNVVQGNLIGTDPTGTRDLGNGFSGILINGAPRNTIGGTQPGARNVISGNDSTGIRLNGQGATNNYIAGNAIGTDVTGTAPLPNRFDGVFLVDAPYNVIANNLISGNGEVGVQVFGQAATGNHITSNLIGTDLQGGSPANLGNGIDGIYLNDATNTQVVGNIVSGSGSAGIQIFGADARGNAVSGNVIGARTGAGNKYGVFINGAPISNQDVQQIRTGNTFLNNTTAALFSVLASSPANVQNQQMVVSNGYLTAVVLTFSKGMNPTTTTNLSNYTVQVAGRGAGVRPASAVYDPLLRTVTLVLRSPVPVSTGILLTVRGTNPGGLTDLNGQLLDGNADGLPGGNFVTRFGGPTRRAASVQPQKVRLSSSRLPRGPRG